MDYYFEFDFAAVQSCGGITFSPSSRGDLFKIFIVLLQYTRLDFTLFFLILFVR